MYKHKTTQGSSNGSESEIGNKFVRIDTAIKRTGEEYKTKKHIKKRRRISEIMARGVVNIA